MFFSAEIGFWVVTRYEDVHAIFKDPATFSSENTQAPYKQRPAAVQQVLDDGDFRAYSGLSARQPPEHTRLRGFVKQAFTPRRIATMEPQVREIATAMIDRLAPRGRGDLVADLAYDLPALVVFRLLGIPDADVPKVKAWAASRVFLNFGDAPVSEQVHHAANLVAYWRYCVDLVESRFDRPRDDLPTDLVRIFQEGDQSISIDEMAGLVYGQLTAGHETTTALLATGIKELLTQRDPLGGAVRRPGARPGRGRGAAARRDARVRLEAPDPARRAHRRRRGARGGERPAAARLRQPRRRCVRRPRAHRPPSPNASRHLAFGYGIHSASAPRSRASRGRSCSRSSRARAVAPPRRGPDVRLLAQQHLPRAGVRARRVRRRCRDRRPGGRRPRGRPRRRPGMTAASTAPSSSSPARAAASAGRSPRASRAAGARVVAADLDAAAAAVTAPALTRRAARGRWPTTTDVGDAASVAAMVAAAVDAFGGVDVPATTRASTPAFGRAPFYDLDEAEWDRVVPGQPQGPLAVREGVRAGHAVIAGRGDRQLSSATVLERLAAVGPRCRVEGRRDGADPRDGTRGRRPRHPREQRSRPASRSPTRAAR